MIWTVQVTPAARLDILEAFDWYEARASGLGGVFVVEADRQIDRIQENPRQFPIAVADIHRARLRRFPYALLFRVEHESVFVIACFHASRDPRRWESRT